MEIGYGCGQPNVGASVKVWNKLFAGREIEKWEAEFDEQCISKAQREGLLEGWNILQGDQENNTVLDGWIKTSGGNFDVIIDDGGHTNSMVLTSFKKLWPTMNPDGLYFIEDLEISFHPAFMNEHFPPASVVLQSWVEQMNVHGGHAPAHNNKLAANYPLPTGVDFILCQRHACVLHKMATTAKPYA